VKPSRNGAGHEAADESRQRPTVDDEPSDDDDALDEIDAHAHEPLDADDEAAIDDPVRMYLMQMGEIPMLNRDDSAARCSAATSSWSPRSSCCRRSPTAICGWTARSKFR
jgi:hypothetical protein